MDNKKDIKRQPQVNNIDNAVQFENECGGGSSDRLRDLLTVDNSTSSFGQLKRRKKRPRQRTSILSF